MICGALPLPNNELYFTYFACAYDYMCKNKRELLKRIRVVDVAYTLANKDAIWMANVMTRSTGFGDFKDKTFKMSDQRKLIPYLHIDEDIAFFRIAWMIYHATDKVNHVLLQWWAENCGFYPFTEFHKSAAIEYFHTGKINLQYDVQPWKADDIHYSNIHDPSSISIAHKLAEAMSTKKFAGSVVDNLNRSNILDRPIISELSTGFIDDITYIDQHANLEDFAEILFKRCPCRMTRSRDINKLINQTKPRTGRKNVKSYNNLNNVENNKNTNNGGGRSNTMPMTLESYAAAYGPTVNIPIVDDDPSLRKFGPTGVTRNEYITLLLSGQINPANIPYGYKIDALCNDEGHRELYFNPNYIVVPGTIVSLTSSFMLGNKDSRMSEKDIHGALEAMIRGSHTMTAHVLPLIPIMNEKNEPTYDALIKLESMRVTLWNDPRCQKATLPIVIGYNDGICVLVESLLESPLFVIETILTQLCNESTVPRDVVLPVPDSIVTHTLATFTAVNVPHRVLKTLNPMTVGNAEMDLLPTEIKDVIKSQDYGTKSKWQWGKHSEEESLARYFQRNGIININPANYTYNTKYERMITSNTSGNRHYPNDINADVIKFDNAATLLQKEVQIEPGMLRVNASNYPTADIIRVDNTTTVQVQKNSVHMNNNNNNTNDTSMHTFRTSSDAITSLFN